MMIRRHFLAGVVGIQAMCAAAALAVGAGQAQAATVDRVTMTLNAEYYCEIGDCEDDPMPSMDFFGLPTGAPLIGWLSIGNKDNRNEQEISFSHNGIERMFGPFLDYSGTGQYESVFAMEAMYVFSIAWDGISGAIRYRDDDTPWSLGVEGTIELAPVPLPATAALLPMGLGALALMRRRHRS